MTSIRFTGWKVGLKTVSLVELVMEEVGSLIHAKRLVDQLLDGIGFALEFDSPERALAFRVRAEQLGAIVE